MLIIGNARVVTLGSNNQVIAGGAVAVEGGTIIDVGPSPDLRAKYPTAGWFDSGGSLVMPGLVNLHTHCYGAFARGLAVPGKPPATFLEILQGLWWRLDRALTLEDVYVSALLGFSDCLRNGTTSVFDHHASPNAIAGSLDAIARAAAQVGLRASLCYEVSDRDGPERAREGIEENVRFARGLRETTAAGDGLVAGCMGLHASLTLSDGTILRAVQEANRLEVGCHIHAAEGPEDVADSLGRYGVRVIRRLFDLGVLGDESIAAHCVHIDHEEIALLAESRTIVAHNVQSNMGNAVGSAPALEMISRGVRVGLGTDGFTADLFEAAAATNILHKLISRNPSAGWEEGRAMALVTPAAVASRTFGRRLGVLEPGAAADLIVVDYDPPTPMDAGNIWGHLLFGVRGGQVRHAFVAGRLVMRDRRILGVDDQELRARARELAAAAWGRFFDKALL